MQTTEQKWLPLATAPQGVTEMVRHRMADGRWWVATGFVHHVEEPGRTEGSWATIIHYNGTGLVSMFYAQEWAPLADD